VEKLAGLGGAFGGEPFVSPVHDFYLTNPIARASAVMADFSATKKRMGQRTTGTHGYRVELVRDLAGLPFVTAGDGGAELGAPGRPAGGHRLLVAHGPQGVGSRAAAPRTQRGGAVRPAAVICRPLEVCAQGARDPGRRRQGRVPVGAAGGVRAG